MSREPLRIAFFTSPIALVMRISREHTSVQFKMVRQRHTPSRSFRMSSRSQAASSRDRQFQARADAPHQCTEPIPGCPSPASFCSAGLRYRK